MSKALVLHKAGEFIRAKRARAKARTNLAKLRREWMSAYDELYERGDSDSRSWWEESEYALSDKIEAALKDREVCNKQFRKTLSSLDQCFGEFK